jgi:hypothetical protein
MAKVVASPHSSSIALNDASQSGGGVSLIIDNMERECTGAAV